MRRIFSLIYEIDIEKGGITSSMMSRSFTFAERGHKIDLVTLDYKDNYDQIEQVLKSAGRLHADVNILNIYDDYKNQHKHIKIGEVQQSYYDQNRNRFEEPYAAYHNEEKLETEYFKNGLYIKKKKWDESDNLLYVDHFNENMQMTKREFFHGGYVNKTVIFDTRSGKINQIHYTAPDGFCYLTEWHHFKTGASQGVMLFGRDEKEAVFFKNKHQFHTHWLETLCEKEKDPIIICDGVGSASKVNEMRAGLAKRFYCVHSNHLDYPYTLGSKVRTNHQYAMEHIKDYDGLIVLTNEQKEDIMKDFESNNNIFVIPHAPRRLEKLQTYEKKKNEFVMVARYHEEKGIDKVIKAMGIVKKSRPDIVLNIYGSGPGHEEYQQLIDDLKLDNVHLKGYVANPAPFYQQALAALLTSKFEGFSLAICESFSCATPVISFDVKYSPRELIKEHETGMLVEPDNIDMLAESIIYLYDNPERAIQYGKNAKNLMDTEYSEARLFERWEKVFEITK
ncbi:glycosyltransferase [Bacillus subtilis]|uniref:glycosyltransferase n=1 Tax=Bacillus subtilis TaxID=1423 RepID=UPI000F0752C5|nr:glycosyltransferase [Bacillus subtilis]MCV2516707.1 glycosyltransferase [Bacillus subtilis]RNA74006.1 glycosyltransferase [Bacillus subtilis]